MMRSCTMIFTAALLAGGAALAHDNATGIVAERMAAMKTMGQELKSIEAILAMEPQARVGALRQHAKALHEICHNAGSLFPLGSLDHHSKALPDIWEKPEAFEAEMERLHRATEALIASATHGDMTKIRTSVEQVQETCRSCHEGFRQPD
jgi:cytochrome c556